MIIESVMIIFALITSHYIAFIAGQCNEMDKRTEKLERETEIREIVSEHFKHLVKKK